MPREKILPIGLETSTITEPLINPLAGCLSCLSVGNISVKIAQFTFWTTLRLAL